MPIRLITRPPPTIMRLLARDVLWDSKDQADTYGRYETTR